MDFTRLVKPGPLLVILGVQAVFLCGLLSLNLFFTLPKAYIEGADILELPSKPLTLFCKASLERPWPAGSKRKGIKIAFETAEKSQQKDNPESKTLLGAAVTGSSGCASISWEPASRQTGKEKIFLKPDLPGDFTYRAIKPKPMVFAGRYEKGTELILLDVGATLSGSSAWEDICPLYPGEWKHSGGAPSHVAEVLSRSLLREVVYLVPGKSLYTTEVRSYLSGRRFPYGPIMFPEAPPRNQPLEKFLKEVAKKWPGTRCGITKRESVAKALAAAGIPAVVIETEKQHFQPAKNRKFAADWSQVPAVLDSF